jgi:Mg/Co/Ni transporter MgtE
MYELSDRDILLARNVLDKQLVDLEGRRLIRVQDVQLSRTGAHIRVLGVDVSTSALLRRMHLWGTASKLARRSPPSSVDWSDVDLGSWRDPTLQLRVSRSSLRRLHPADLAEIAAALPPAEGVELIRQLDAGVAADTLEEMPLEDQVRMLEALGLDDAVHLLAEMAPDDAADLVKALDRKDAEVLLERMRPEEATEIRSLLGYAEETAGALMTTEVFTAAPAELAGDVIERLRHRPPDEEHAHHLYVIDPTGVLVGELSLYELVIADPRTPVADLMRPSPISIEVGELEDQVVDAIMKYNLLAVPVVDAGERLVGVITVDDVIDLVGPGSAHHGFLR